MLIEETVDSKRIFIGRVVKLRIDTVKTPSKSVITREVIDHGGAAAIVPILDDGSVILVKQFRYALGKALTEVPAGKLEEGESPEECARRELLEETNYEAGRLEKLFQCYLAPGYSNELIHIFLASDLVEKGQQKAPEETIRIIRVKLEEALSMIWRGEIEDAKSISSLLTVAMKKDVKG